MKHLITATLLLTTALLTAMQGGSSSLLEKQQYATRIQQLSNQLGCASNHAQDVCSTLARLTQQITSAEIAPTISSTITALRIQHTQLTQAYAQLAQAQNAQYFHVRLNKIANALALLDAHINTSITLHTQAEQGTQSQ